MNVDSLDKKFELDVIMPFHRHDMALREALKSLKAAMRPTYRLILVNDTNREVEIPELDNFSELLRISSYGSGYQEALKVGIQASTADFIAFLDSDDLTDPNRLEIQIRALKETKSDISTCQLQKFRLTRNGNIRYVSSSLGPTLLSDNSRLLLTISSIGADSTLVAKRRLIIKQLNVFLSSPSQYADYCLISSLDCNVRLTCVPEKLYFYRMSKSQMSRDRMKISDWNQVHKSWIVNLKCLSRDYPSLATFADLKPETTYSLMNATRIRGNQKNISAELARFLDALMNIEISSNVMQNLNWKITITGRRLICLGKIRVRDTILIILWVMNLIVSIIKGNQPRRNR